MRKRNLWVASCCLLLAAAILLGEAGWIPHGLKLLLMVLACALELWGSIPELPGAGGVSI